MDATQLDAGTRQRVRESDLQLIAMCREAELSEGHKSIVFDAIRLRANLMKSYFGAAQAVDKLMMQVEAQGRADTDETKGAE